MRLLKEDFCDILEKQRIKPLFQPIVSLKDGEIQFSFGKSHLRGNRKKCGGGYEKL